MSDFVDSIPAAVRTTKSFITTETVLLVLAIAVAFWFFIGHFGHSTPHGLGTSETFQISLKAGGSTKSEPTVDEDEDEDDGDEDRSIVAAMGEQNRNYVIVYGSQTGTAEAYTSRLARDGRSSSSLRTMAVDAEDYDWTDLHKVKYDHVIVFVLATYGEGDPTDNAVGLHDTILAFANKSETSFSNLKYATFGLGNKTYENYNRVSRNVDEALHGLGAQRLGPVGEGDDAEGTMEDFLSWKDAMWQDVSNHLGIEEHQAAYEPILKVVDRRELSSASPGVYLGEASIHQLKGLPVPSGQQQPSIATVTQSRELFHMADRNCVHIEIDLAESGLRYETGDHIAVWPMNANEEVDRFLSVNGLLNRCHDVVDIRSLDPSTKVPCPTPITLDTMVRYYFEIGAAVSRQVLSSLVPFTPYDSARDMMTKLSKDADYFAESVSAKYLNLAQVLELTGGGQKWEQVPFAFYLESLSRLHPRYYSISSSSLMNPGKVAITAVVQTLIPPRQSSVWEGVASNYLLAITQGSDQYDSVQQNDRVRRYAIDGPRGKYGGSRIPVCIRPSKFRLPEDLSAPVIMVGPGAGVAPFRAFLQERVVQVQSQEKRHIGKMMLFYGCRKRSEDFLYEDEFKVCFSWCGIPLPYLLTYDSLVLPKGIGRPISISHCLFSGG